MLLAQRLLLMARILIFLLLFEVRRKLISHSLSIILMQPIESLLLILMEKQAVRCHSLYKSHHHKDLPFLHDCSHL